MKDIIIIEAVVLAVIFFTLPRFWGMDITTSDGFTWGLFFSALISFLITPLIYFINNIFFKENVSAPVSKSLKYAALSFLISSGIVILFIMNMDGLVKNTEDVVEGLYAILFVWPIAVIVVFVATIIGYFVGKFADKI